MTNEALVTGGSGFIGSHLCEHLLATRWKVRVLDLTEPVWTPTVDWIDADVRDAETLLRSTPRSGVVFHLASVVGVEQVLSDPVQTVDVIVNGTLNALAAATARSARLVYLSSSEVLGNNPHLPWSERDDRIVGSPLVDRWTYGSAKAAAEHIVIGGGRTGGIRTCVVRPFNVYGPRQSDRFVVTRMIDAALRREAIMVHGDGMQSRAFTYVADVADAIARAGIDDVAAELLHVGATRQTTIIELAQLIANLAESSIPYTLVDPAEVIGSQFEPIAHRLPDVTEAAVNLDWKADTPLEEGLCRTVEWMRQPPPRT